MQFSQTFKGYMLTLQLSRLGMIFFLIIYIYIDIDINHQIDD
jgi:hypothetical protein